MGFEDEVEQSLTRLAGNYRQIQADIRTHLSIVPRGTPFHHWVELGFPPSSLGLVDSLRGCSLSGPTELSAINPDAVHDHSQPARQRDDRLLSPAVAGDLHRPGFEPGPFC
jgi:hypothetical protein